MLTIIILCSPSSSRPESVMQVRDAMTTNAVAIQSHASIAQAIEVMLRSHVNGIRAFNGRVVGAIARADLLRALATQSPEPTEKRMDVAIRDSIPARLNQQDLAPASLVDFDVHDGIVELRGSLADERQRIAIQAIVENAPGMSAIGDHLVRLERHSSFRVLCEQDAEAEKASARRADLIAAKKAGFQHVQGFDGLSRRN